VSQVERWLSRWAPLAGVPAAALILVALLSGGSNSPNSNAPVAQVVSFYTAHATGQKVSALMGTLGLVFFVFFAVALAGRLRDRGAAGWLANGIVGGAVAAMVGLLSLLAFGFVLADNIKFLSPGSVQTLNVLDNNFFLAANAGFIIFGVVAGLAVAVSKAPAWWMGWVLFALGIICAVPPLSWFAFLAMLVWSLVAGIWLAARKPAQVRASEPDVALTAA